MTPFDERSGIRVLPVFQGWTVDVRLREFRRVARAADGTPGMVEFARFDSDQGRELYAAYERRAAEQALCHALTGGYHCGKCGECCGFLGCERCEPETVAKELAAMRRADVEYRRRWG